MRDDFPRATKDRLAKRVGFRCSNPDCRRQTTGPLAAEAAITNIGVAAHIAAASGNGPRYDPKLTSNERKSQDNGIWLCQTCAKLIDDDTSLYTKEVLKDWKDTAEATALLELKGFKVGPDRTALLKRLSESLAELFDEMSNDLKQHPFVREFIILEREVVYNGDCNNRIFIYYFNDHQDLRQKLRILENNMLVSEITYNNVDRFQLSEELVEFLSQQN